MDEPTKIGFVKTPRAGIGIVSETKNLHKKEIFMSVKTLLQILGLVCLSIVQFLLFEVRGQLINRLWEQM